MAFLIILASNSAGVNMRLMTSLSKFLDSSDFRSFIRSCGGRGSKCMFRDRVSYLWVFVGMTEIGSVVRDKNIFRHAPPTH